MAIRGKRRTERDHDREVFWCTCWDSDHQLILWVKSHAPDHDWFSDETVIEVGTHPITIQQRLRDAWRTLRGYPTCAAEVILPYAEAVALRDGLTRNLQVIEAHTTPTPSTTGRIFREQAVSATGHGPTIAPSWRVPTTAGNCLVLIAQWDTASAAPIGYAWGSPVVTAPGMAAWVIPNAGVRLGAEAIHAVQGTRLSATVIEYSGIAATNPVDQARTADGAWSTNPSASIGPTAQDYALILAAFRIGHDARNAYAPPRDWARVSASDTSAGGATDGIVIDTTQIARSAMQATVGLGETPHPVDYTGIIVALKGALPDGPRT